MFLLFISLSSLAQQNIFELNQQLGRGVNLGNMMEAPTETEWGNPFKDAYMKTIADMGFTHIRIPIRWDTPERTLPTDPYTINPVFLARIKHIVDLAYAQNLMVIIDMHHHDAIFKNPEKEHAKFIAQWTQISDYFKDYDSKLIFEVLNEPNSALTPEKWNDYFKDALAVIRVKNPSRAVLMGVANWGGLSALSQLEIPADENLILTIHYYAPFTFTHQGAEWVDGSDAWLGTPWLSTSIERQEIKNDFQYAIQLAAEKNIPIHIGEFGAYSTADNLSRLKWSNFLASWFSEQGFSWTYWEFSSGFGFYNPNTGEVKTDLLEALLKENIYEEEKLESTLQYESSFENTDPWNLYTNGEGKGTLELQNKEAAVNIETSSTESWHIQLVRNNIALKKGASYVVSFDAHGSGQTQISHYLGKSTEPYTNYSGFKTYDILDKTQSFIYLFEMTEPTDVASRIVFDLGTSAGTVAIGNVRIEEVKIEEEVVLGEFLQQESVTFPNPVEDTFMLRIKDGVSGFRLFDTSGKQIRFSDNLKNKEILIDMKSLPSGVYMLQCFGKDASYYQKIVKW